MEKVESFEKDNEAQKSFTCPPRRRRSTFFEKRDTIVPEPAVENIELNECRKIIEVNEKHNQELKRYHDLLLAEKHQWQTEVKSRRSKYHNLRQQFQIASTSSRISYSVLSNEDIEFLKGKINVSQLVEGQANLHKSVMHTRECYRRATELDSVILDHCDKKLSNITDYILQNSNNRDQFKE